MTLSQSEHYTHNYNIQAVILPHRLIPGTVHYIEFSWDFEYTRMLWRVLFIF